VPIEAIGLGLHTISIELGEIEFRRLLDKLPVGAYTCDVTGLITYYNSHAVSLWGRAPLLNNPIDRFCGSFRLYCAKDGLPIRHDECWMALALQNDREYNGQEILVERPDGQRLSALAYANPLRDENGRLRGAVNVLVDITDQKRAQQHLRDLKDQLALQLIDLKRLHDMSVRLSTTLELGPILDETLRTAAAIDGTDMGLLSLCDDDQRHLRVGSSLGFAAEFVETLGNGGAGGDGACGMCFRERRRVVIEDTDLDSSFAAHRAQAHAAGFRAVHSTPLVTRSGKILGVLSTHFRRPHRPTDRQMHLIDLCARQAVDYIENAQLYAQLRQADRAKDEFLATLAHELRNPLAPLRNALQILRLHNTSTSPDARWATDVMERQMQQMTRLVDDLLDVSRITRNKLELRRERVELANVINIALETSRPQLDAPGHEFSLSLPDEPIHLDADLTRLAQAVANLLNNASKYTPPGGKIELTAARDGSDAVIRVRDTGIGIAPDMLGRVFDMFAQADRSTHGSRAGLGIGLTLVKRLVELHGGTVEARSDGPRAGSEFIIRLPILIGNHAHAARRSDAGDARADDAAAGAALRILVVDDNRDSANSLGRLLRITGNIVRTAYDGQEAIETAEAFRPDVILADIGMPRLNGHDAAKHIRQQPWGSSIVLVAISGWGQDGDKQQSREAGFDHHIVKPIDPERLLELLSTFQQSAAKNA
jgi:signal transduction histidine kinase/ActR/RegA family two-component response regulator